MMVVAIAIGDRLNGDGYDRGWWRRWQMVRVAAKAMEIGIGGDGDRQ